MQFKLNSQKEKPKKNAGKTFSPPENFRPVAFVSSSTYSNLTYVVWLRFIEKNKKEWGCTCPGFHFRNGPCKHMTKVFQASRKIRKGESLKDIDKNIIFAPSAKEIILPKDDLFSSLEE